MPLSLNETALFKAVKENDANTIIQLCSKGKQKINLNCVRSDDYTPLQLAIYYGRFDVIKALLKQGANPNQVNKYSTSPLQSAAGRGNTLIIETLIKNGAKVNYINKYDDITIKSALASFAAIEIFLKHGAKIDYLSKYGWNLLHSASSSGYVSSIDILIKKGININQRTSTGRTPLHLATTDGYLATIESLIMHGADVNLVDEDGVSPLFNVVQRSKTKAVKLLLYYGAKADIVDKKGKTALDYAKQRYNTQEVINLLSSPNRLNNASSVPKAEKLEYENEKALFDAIKNFDKKKLQQLCKKKIKGKQNKLHSNAHRFLGWTPLTCAAYYGNFNAIEILIKQGADVNQIDENGRYPLHNAASKGYVDIIEVLIKHGAKVNQEDKKNKNSPLHLAVKHGNLLAVETLIKHEANVNQIKKDLLSPLTIAASKGYIDIMELLIKHGANVNYSTEYYSPLFKASSFGLLDPVDILLKNGADVNYADYLGATPLHITTKNGNTGIIDLLIKNGANVNHKDHLGNTLLKNLVSCGYANAIVVLINHGADVNLANKKATTPLMVAAQKNHTDVIRIFLTHKATLKLKDKEGKTALDYAQKNNNEGIIDLLSVAEMKYDNELLEQRALQQQEKQKYESALFKAVNANDVKTIHQLCQKDSKGKQKVDPNCVNKDDWTPLRLAAFYGFVKIIDALVSLGADINKSNKNGANPLFIACQEGKVDAIKTLIAYESDVNQVKYNGFTPLMIAVYKNHTVVVKLLLKHKAKYDKKNNSGKTALFYAKKNKNPELIALLSPAKKPVPASPAASPSMSPMMSSPKGSLTFVLKEIAHDVITLGDKLGQGGFGAVYKATYRMRDVAVKELNAPSLSENAMTEFKNEASIMAGIQSERIVQLFAITMSHPYRLVMELMPKGSLFSVLQNNQDLPWKIRYQISLDIAFGLFDLHNENVLHRDLKSLNVLLDNNLRAKLTDFGLSKVKTETTSASKVGNKTVGSVMWMAPELFNRKTRKHTKMSDIYAMGITFWEIASRKIPYEDADGNQQLVMKWIEEGEKEIIPEDCPSNYASLFQQCWDGDANKRPELSKVINSLKSSKEVLDKSKAKDKGTHSGYQGNLESNVFISNPGK